MPPTTLTRVLADPAEVGEDDLLLRAAAGDRVAFAALYDRVMPHVFGVVVRVLRDRSLAEETAQEVMTEAWRKAGRFDPERGTAQAWLVTLARRRAIDRVRSEQASRDRDDRAAHRDLERSFDQVADEVETRLDHRRVRDALAALTPRQREAVHLAYFRGHTYRDVATVLSIPEGTAKSRLREALARLREVLEEPG